MSVFRRVSFFAAIAAVALSAPAALSAPESAITDGAPIKGWTAVAGLSGPAVVALARTLPLTSEARSDQPWCARTGAVDAALRTEFDERPVTGRSDGTQLWGSDLMGTWTLVLGRGDGTGCIVASGIGYRDGTDPLDFYAKVDLS